MSETNHEPVLRCFVWFFLRCYASSWKDFNTESVICESEVDLSTSVGRDEQPRPLSLDDWTKVYEGLSDQPVAKIDRIAKAKADLTRLLP